MPTLVVRVLGEVVVVVDPESNTAPAAAMMITRTTITTITTVLDTALLGAFICNAELFLCISRFLD